MRPILHSFSHHCAFFTPNGCLQSLVALLWALASLRAAQLHPLLRAVSQRLADHMEACLEGVQTQGPQGPTAAEFEDAELVDGGELSPASTAVNGSAGHNISSSGGGSGGSSSEDGRERASATGPAMPAQGRDRALPADQLCTVVWACGQLRHEDPRLLAAATTLMHGRVHKLAPTETAR